MKKRMNIYVASSWRNPYQPEVVAHLHALGHEVYDFRNPVEGDNGFSWKELDPDYYHGKKWDINFYRHALESPQAERGFRHDITAVMRADACVYVLPCGRSASWEFGFIVGRGKLGVVYMPEPCEPDLMFKECKIVGNLNELTRVFETAYQGPICGFKNCDVPAKFGLKIEECKKGINRSPTFLCSLHIYSVFSDASKYEPLNT